MNCSFIILIVGLVIFISYNVFFVLATHSYPISLSETYYTLKTIKKGWLFPLMLSVCALSLMPIWITISDENYQCLTFIACTASVFVAFSPNYHEDLEKQVHYISAYICCITSVLWQLLSGYWIMPLLCFTPCLYPILKKDEHYALYLEIATIISIYITLLFIV